MIQNGTILHNIKLIQALYKAGLDISMNKHQK